MTVQAPTVPSSRSDREPLVRFGPCRALEHRFELTVPRHGGFVEELGSLVRPFRVGAERSSDHGHYVVQYSATAEQYELLFDGQRISGAIRAIDLRMPLSWHINRRVIDTSVDRYTLLHGAAVTVAGMTIVMPADQECGKTTTTAGLLRGGFHYVTDEAVAIDPRSGAVVPFPKTLSLDPGSWELFPELGVRHHRPGARQWHVPPGELGAAAETKPVAPPALVVIPNYVGGGRTTWEKVHPAAGVRELALLTFHFDRHVRRNLGVLAALALRAPVVRLKIGSLEGAVDAIEHLISDRILEDA